MPEHRRQFSPQFRAEAVQMVIETGKPIAEVARDLGIHEGTLGNWVSSWRRVNPEADTPVSPVDRARVQIPSAVRRSCATLRLLIRLYNFDRAGSFGAPACGRPVAT
jgi:transposase